MWPALLLAPSLHLPVHEHTLSNGLEVVFVIDGRAPLIATELTFGVGAAEDELARDGLPGRQGVAHLVEHLMFEGDYDALLAEAGGESNAWTSHDWTVYTAAAPADALERLLYLEGQRLADPLRGVSDDDLENQIAVVLAERSLARGGGRGDRALTESLYPPDHPLHGPVLGDPEDLGNISRDEIAAFLGAWYQPANATLVIGGDIDPEHVLARAEHWLGGIDGVEVPGRAVARSAASAGRHTLEEGTPPTVMLAWPTVPRGHPDEPALDLLADALSTALAGRVEAGRLDEGRAWTENGRLGGRLVISLSHHRRSMRALLREAERIRDRAIKHSVPAVELTATQERWRMHYVRAAQSLESRVSLVAGCVRSVDEADCLEAEIVARESLSSKDILSAAQRYLLPEAQVTVGVHPSDKRPLPAAAEVDPL